MKKLLKITILLVVISMALSACGNNSSKLTNNKWMWNNEATLIFFDDGTYDWGGWGSGSYSVKEDTLLLARNYMGTHTYRYEIHGDTLTLYQDDSSNIFTLEKVS